MSYALYVDPLRQPPLAPEWPVQLPTIAYWRLIDLSEEQLAEFNPHVYPHAVNTTAEIHPAQLARLPLVPERLSIVLQKSSFDNLGGLRSRLDHHQCDITFIWDHRFHVSYYTKMLQYWLHIGVQHVSFYELTDFKKWLQLKEFLQKQNFFFYDRYHACLPGCESPYQKHIAKFGDLISIGGWSRLTEDGSTRTRGPNDREWQLMSADEQQLERLLFAFADRDGMALADLIGLDVQKAVSSGLARVEADRLVPTDLGLWDTVGLVSQLHNKKAA